MCLPAGFAPSRAISTMRSRTKRTSEWTSRASANATRPAALTKSAASAPTETISEPVANGVSGALTSTSSERCWLGGASGTVKYRDGPSWVFVSPSPRTSSPSTRRDSGRPAVASTTMLPSARARISSAPDRSAARWTSSARSSSGVALSRAASVSASTRLRSWADASLCAFSCAVPKRAITTAVAMPTTTTTAGASTRNGSFSRRFNAGKVAQSDESRANSAWSSQRVPTSSA